MNRPRDPGRTVRVTVVLLFSLASTPSQATTWPQVDLPSNASVHGVDSVTTIDGLPIKMQGFVSALTVTELARWYRHKLGDDVVENTLGPKLVLGQGKGEYFITVQLEAIAGKTRAIVAVAHLTAGMQQRQATEAANARLLERLPSGTRVVSRLAALDGPRNAIHVVLSNGYGSQVNRDALVRMQLANGLALEHEARTASDGTTLFFKGSGAEAIAVLTRGRDGKMTIVMNSTTFMNSDQ